MSLRVMVGKEVLLSRMRVVENLKTTREVSILINSSKIV